MSTKSGLKKTFSWRFGPSKFNKKFKTEVRNVVITAFHSSKLASVSSVSLMVTCTTKPIHGPAISAVET